MASEASEKLHTLTMAIIVLALEYVQVAFAMGAKPTWFPPVYFGVCSVTYILLIIVAEFEENASVKLFVDRAGHVAGYLSLLFLIAIVSVGFAIGLASSTTLIGFWYLVKHLKNNITNISQVQKS